MAQNLTLWGLIEGESTAFFVDVSPSTCIGRLKEEIVGKKQNTFPHVDADKLVLVEATPNTILESISKDDRKLLKASDYPEVENEEDVSDHWVPPPPGHKLLSFIVQIPEDQDTRPAKKARTDIRFMSPGPQPAWDLWTRLWQNEEQFIIDLPVVRGDNPVEDVDVPSHCSSIIGHEFFPGINHVLIREEYKIALSEIEDAQDRKVQSVVVVGHPGIGKTLFLYYILVTRLASKKPTAFQFASDHVLLFDGEGVHRISSHASQFDLSGIIPRGTWALADTNQGVKHPTELFAAAGSPFFVVEASSPRTSHWEGLKKYRSPMMLWFMNPCTLPEVLQARDFQMYASTEENIQEFFQKCGPSARDCYQLSDKIPTYLESVRRKVKSMGWDGVTKALLLVEETLQMDDSSYQVILIGPQPGERGQPSAEMMSKTIANMMFDLKIPRMHSLPI